MRMLYKQIVFGLLVLMAFTMPGCKLIGDIFGAGVWVGVIASVLVVLIIIFIVVKIIKAFK